MRTAIALVILICSWANAQTTPVRKSSITGTVKSHQKFESKILGNSRNLYVYLPPGYSASKERYQVLYMHDGQNVFDGMTSFLPNIEWRADEAAEALIRAKAIPPIIIVGIENAGMERANEFLPTSGKLGNGPPVGGKADKYGEFIIREIMPFIDRTYRTKTGPQNTGLCGSSFGGVITMYLGLTHSDRFSKLGVVSPSVWWDNKLLVQMVKKLPRKLPLKVWLDMGTQEGPFAVQDAQLLHDALGQKGWKSGRDLLYYVDGFMPHNEDAWSRRIGMILMYLFGRT